MSCKPGRKNSQGVTRKKKPVAGVYLQLRLNPMRSTLARRFLRVFVVVATTEGVLVVVVAVVVVMVAGRSLASVGWGGRVLVLLFCGKTIEEVEAMLGLMLLLLLLLPTLAAGKEGNTCPNSRKTKSAG
jgi:hypothetical protein